VLRGDAASTLAALLLVVPAVTASASAVALGETLRPASLAGMLVAVAGVGAVVRREAAPVASRRARAPRAEAAAGRVG
jgi:drug/metabolite transporter (DMT)-like permease